MLFSHHMFNGRWTEKFQFWFQITKITINYYRQAHFKPENTYVSQLLIDPVANVLKWLLKSRNENWR